MSSVRNRKKPPLSSVKKKPPQSSAKKSIRVYSDDSLDKFVLDIADIDRYRSVQDKVIHLKKSQMNLTDVTFIAKKFSIKLNEKGNRKSKELLLEEISEAAWKQFEEKKLKSDGEIEEKKLESDGETKRCLQETARFLLMSSTTVSNLSASFESFQSYQLVHNQDTDRKLATQTANTSDNTRRIAELERQFSRSSMTTAPTQNSLNNANGSNVPVTIEATPKKSSPKELLPTTSGTALTPHPAEEKSHSIASTSRDPDEIGAVVTVGDDLDAVDSNTYAWTLGHVKSPSRSLSGADDVFGVPADEKKISTVPSDEDKENEGFAANALAPASVGGDLSETTQFVACNTAASGSNGTPPTEGAASGSGAPQWKLQQEEAMALSSTLVTNFNLMICAFPHQKELVVADLLSFVYENGGRERFFTLLMEQMEGSGVILMYYDSEKSYDVDCLKVLLYTFSEAIGAVYKLVANLNPVSPVTCSVLEQVRNEYGKDGQIVHLVDTMLMYSGKEVSSVKRIEETSDSAGASNSNNQVGHPIEEPQGGLSATFTDWANDEKNQESESFGPASQITKSKNHDGTEGAELCKEGGIIRLDPKSSTAKRVSQVTTSKPASKSTALKSILDPANKPAVSAPEKLEVTKPEAAKPEDPLSPMQTYEMSDREEESESESESDDEYEKPGPKKNIPEWARKANLHRALERQFADGPDRQDPDKIFGEVITCNLEEIFDKKKSRYQRRTSSGDWTKDHVTLAEKLTYKRVMGYDKK